MNDTSIPFEPIFHNSKWRKARMRCLVRDKFRCQQPGCKVRNLALLTIHHIKPRSEGGTNHIDNLITLCWEHHFALHGYPKDHDELRTVHSVVCVDGEANTED